MLIGLLFSCPFVSFAHELKHQFGILSVLWLVGIRICASSKKTKTYGLVRLGEPYRQGRSLSLPTLPYQKTNRYAVVSATH
ncbi:MAG: hypothetical protein D8H98_05015 [Prevotella sp.]|nr:MAG: hypothetical protein D8H98_05015 [Prevotella sp.]